MKLRLIQTLVAVVALAALLYVGRVTRDATLTRHDEVEAGSSLSVELSVAIRGGAEAEEANLARSLVSLCELEVAGRVIPGSFTPTREHRYRFVLTPSLDEADRTQLHGCLQDFRVDQFLAHVVRMTHHPPPAD